MMMSFCRSSIFAGTSSSNFLYLSTLLCTLHTGEPPRIERHVIGRGRPIAVDWGVSVPAHQPEDRAVLKRPKSGARRQDRLRRRSRKSQF